MAITIRIIETGAAIGGKLFHTYVFCLPVSKLDKTQDVIEALIAADGPVGVYQVVSDDAGVMVYIDDRLVGIDDCLLAIVKDVINPILGMDFEVVLDTKGRSCFWVSEYGRWQGATTLGKLMSNQHFVLPYMTE